MNLFNLLPFNKQITDSHNADIQNLNSVQIIDSVTQQLRNNIRSNSKSNSKIILQQLFSNQKNQNTSNDQEQQTILNYTDVDYVEQQNQELRVLIDRTISNMRISQSNLQSNTKKLN
ncbi:unnamed protein product (macronuclear) [Paramecium tetraurelia]|uniref:Uncharacterized protein n=1 Tax=Paramecium tetraurelia TaxID=5888 RepID=A0BGK1_PARTE|nr:uncharacterized protein GSPATT00028703001 [Paramecium tetraurelia]CAK57668.1 unnamed protein product [Paramecium tetraurelia]|eukprot:XP_001425066.1 hypothetical protein (macronuclear) [Paramecium tetraurelia strain d4-2]